MSRARVLVLHPALGPLDYRVPAGMQVAPGSIVVVPIGPRQYAGVVWEAERLPTEEIGDNRLRNIMAVADAPPIPASVRRLVEYTRAGRRIVRASDYACPVPREPAWDDHEARLRQYAGVLATCTAATPRFRLTGGEILAMDNYRFLHGRDGYSGTRLMHVLTVLSTEAM